jgi:transmembrane E3 ubiquitin-protein ligase
MGPFLLPPEICTENLDRIISPNMLSFSQMAASPAYDYHPLMPRPDPEAPEKSLGDCSICMDAILIGDSSSISSSGRGSVDGNEALVRRTGEGRKHYSLAPCHHLFVSCLAVT